MRINFRSGPVAYEIDMDQLPARSERSGSKLLATFIVVFALFWGGAPLYGLMTAPPGQIEGAEVYIFMAFPIIAIGLLAYGLHLFIWRKTILFDGLQVTVTQRGLRGTKFWREVVTNYRGVKSHRRQVQQNKRNYTLYLVDLLHDDDDKTINLYTSTSDSDWRGRWEYYARRLDLPALEEGAGGLIARDVADLDKSVAELLDEGKISVDYDALGQKAEGLATDIEGETIVITRTGPQMGLIGSLIFLLFPLIFVYVGFFHDDAPFPTGLLFGALGLLFEIVGIAGVAWDRITRYRLRASREGVRINSWTRWGETKGKIMAAPAIEGVKIAREKGKHYNSVVISGDQKTLAFGRGLPAESLDFVRNAILAKLARDTRSP